MIMNVSEQIPETSKPASRTAGAQTLARGLDILRTVVGSADGMTNNEVAEGAGVHRTAASRILNTLCDAGMLHRAEDGRYRGAVGLLSLAGSAHQSLKAAAAPVLRRCANDLGATVALIVREGNDAVALVVTAPAAGMYHVAFAESSRHPLERGAAGHAVLAAEEAAPGEDPRVSEARRRGYARTFGEVEPGMHGLAIPIPRSEVGVAACLNLITVRGDQADAAVGILREAVAQILDRIR